MFNKNSTFRLSADILKRYESTIEDGVLFLYNVKTDEYWTGNSSTNDLITKFDGKKTLAQVYDELYEQFAMFKIEDVKNSFDKIILELVEKKYLVIVGDMGN